MTFTAEEAFEANQNGEPILIDVGFAAYLCRSHQVDPVEFLGFEPSRDPCVESPAKVDAWSVLSWLGY